MGRDCADCDAWCDRDEFSNNQWRKGVGRSRCEECVEQGRPQQSWSPPTVGRVCVDCDEWRDVDEFSNNQWRKGEHSSRCTECVDQGLTQHSAWCDVCDRGFTSQNNLQMHMQTHEDVWCRECDRVFSTPNSKRQHMQVHLPRNVACPICGDVRFKSATNAVQHVETGGCPGCPGADNARNAIYGFVRQRGGHLLAQAPMLEYGGRTATAPALPYECQFCTRAFRQLSSMMQHQAAAHQTSAPALGWM